MTSKGAGSGRIKKTRRRRKRLRHSSDAVEITVADVWLIGACRRAISSSARRSLRHLAQLPLNPAAFDQARLHAFSAVAGVVFAVNPAGEFAACARAFTGIDAAQERGAGEFRFSKVVHKGSERCGAGFRLRDAHAPIYGGQGFG